MDPITAAKLALLLSDKETLKKLFLVLAFLILLVFFILLLPLIAISGALLMLVPSGDDLADDIHAQAVASVKAQYSISNELPTSVVKTADFIIDGEIMTRGGEIKSFIRNYFIATKTIEVEVEEPVGDPADGITQTVKHTKKIKVFLSAEELAVRLQASPFSFAADDILLIKDLYAEGDNSSPAFPPSGAIVGGDGVLALVQSSSAHITRGMHDVGTAAGVDIAAPTGTPIVAAFDGNVNYYICKSFSGAIVSYGAVAFQVSSDGKHIATYAHLSQFDTPESRNDISKYPSRRIYKADIKEFYHSAFIAKGTVIGYVGNTGNSTGPHLHFGLLAGGKVVDPLIYLK